VYALQDAYTFDRRDIGRWDHGNDPYENRMATFYSLDQPRGPWSTYRVSYMYTHGAEAVAFINSLAAYLAHREALGCISISQLMMCSKLFLPLGSGD
jgi:hypothetical protein